MSTLTNDILKITSTIDMNKLLREILRAYFKLLPAKSALVIVKKNENLFVCAEQADVEDEIVNLAIRPLRRLTGLLYLENNISAGAFTPQRLEILNMLSSQAAVSLENAMNTFCRLLVMKEKSDTTEAPASPIQVK